MKNLNKPSFLIIFWGIISALFLLLFSYTTSPLYNVCGFDSAVFKVMSRALLHGKTLYVDVFDHKGPVLYFLNALGMLISYHFGLYIIQCIFLTITTILWYKTAFLFLNDNKKAVIAVLVTLIALYGVIKEGNKTEEWCLLFTSIPMYWAFKYCLINKSLPYIYTMCMGMCFAAIAFIRINNGAFVSGIILGYMIIYVVNKQYLALLKQGVCFLCGILIVAAIICLYFYHITALSDMVFGTFLFNMSSYGESSSIMDIYNNELLSIFVYGFGGLVIISASKRIKQNYGNKMLFLLFPIVIFVLIFSAYQHPFHNYYISILPVVLLASIFILKLELNRLIICIMLAPYIVAGAMWIFLLSSNYHAIKIYHKEIAKVMSNIPKSDYDSVYNYNVVSEGFSCFLDSDIVPMNKHFYMGTREILHMDFKEDVEKYSPKWITAIYIRDENIPEGYIAVDSVMMNDVKISNATPILYVPKLPFYLYKKVDNK